jgi:hypothetical protein
MENNQTYKLEIHVDSTQITKEILEEKITQVLKKYENKDGIKIEIYTPNECYHQLIINGDIESVDSCHHKIQKNILTELNLRFYRCVDQAGDEIRYRLYPILADIEQRFRFFINKALSEISGFNWWENFVPEKISKGAITRYSKAQREQIIPHYLECTFFDDLIILITSDYSSFQEDQPFTNKSFDELLQDCQSFDELKSKWDKKKQIFSYWDIFAKYFEDRKQWEDLKKDLYSDSNKDCVYEVRNKVMHYRPIRFYLIKKLEEIRNSLISIIDDAKPELSKEQRAEAQKEAEKILSSRELRKYIDKLELDMNRHLNRYLNSARSPLDEALESTRNAFNRSLNEPLTSARKMLNESILNPRNTIMNPIDLHRQAMDKTINKISSDIRSIANLDKPLFNITPPIPIAKKDYLTMPIAKKDYLSLSEQTRKQISDRPRLPSGIQDVIEAFERENTLRQKIETPLENLRKFFY